MPGPALRGRLVRIIDRPLEASVSRGTIAALTIAGTITAMLCATVVPVPAAAARQVARQWTGPWAVESSAHFDVFYQPAAAPQLSAIVSRAEDAYERVSRDFRHDLVERIRLVVVTNDRDMPASDPEFEALIRTSGSQSSADHIVLPVSAFAAGSEAAIHEITHVFLFDIIPQSSASYRWLAEGIAEHERGMWNPSELADVRQAAAQGRVPTIDRLVDADRQWGHAVTEFVVATYGEDGLRRYLFELRRHPGQIADATESAFGVPLNEFSRQFVAYMAKAFAAN